MQYGLEDYYRLHEKTVRLEEAVRKLQSTVLELEAQIAALEEKFDEGSKDYSRRSRGDTGS